uniref:Uncharacterized protein n=1 Tax=Anguilla anguilla TaxID=7936 RepID=A0A0E9W5F6_ANGAN
MTTSNNNKITIQVQVRPYDESCRCGHTFQFSCGRGILHFGK